MKHVFFLCVILWISLLQIEALCFNLQDQNVICWGLPIGLSFGRYVWLKMVSVAFSKVIFPNNIFVIIFFIYVDTTGYIIYNNIVNLQLYYFQWLLQIVNLVDFPCKENIWLMENYPLWCCSSYFSNSALHSSVAGQSVKVHQRAISSIFKQSGEQQHGFGCLIWPSHCVRSQDWKINTLMCTRVNTPEQERETSRQFCLWCCFTC